MYSTTIASRGSGRVVKSPQLWIAERRTATYIHERGSPFCSHVPTVITIPFCSGRALRSPGRSSSWRPPHASAAVSRVRPTWARPPSVPIKSGRVPRLMNGR